MNLTKYLLTTLLFFGVSTAMPTRSEAFITAGAVYMFGSDNAELLVTVGAIGAEFTAATLLTISAFKPGRNAWGKAGLIALGAVALVLDIDSAGNPGSGQFEDLIATKYAFNDNREIIREISETLYGRLIASPTNEKSLRTASMSRSEILNTLDQTSVASDDPRVEQMILDLE